MLEVFFDDVERWNNQVFCFPLIAQISADFFKHPPKLGQI
jgi:hypothetical protein